MQKVLLTGADGRFGRDFLASCGARFDCRALLESDCDIRRLERVRAVLRQIRPKVVIHAAAFTDVDRAESQPELAFGVNALGSRNVALAAEEVGAWVIAISTDFVFSGRSDRPYHEFDPPNPTSVYGRSKLAGEQAVAAFCRRWTVIRTAWLYGDTGPCFPRTIIRKLRESAVSGHPVRVVSDQRGNPTSTRALAGLVEHLVDAPIPGVVHGSCEGEVSWYGYARRIQELLRLDGRLEPCTTAEYPRPASRPANSALDKLVLRLEGRPAMPGWDESLQLWIRENRHDSL